MLAFGIIGYFMEENGFPVAPAILGMVLGAMLEEHFIRAMIRADGQFIAFVQRPIAAGLAAAVLIVVLWPLALWLFRSTIRSPARRNR
jgi:TctA family transporter